MKPYETDNDIKLSSEYTKKADDKNDGDNKQKFKITDETPLSLHSPGQYKKREDESINSIASARPKESKSREEWKLTRVDSTLIKKEEEKLKKAELPKKQVAKKPDAVPQLKLNQVAPKFFEMGKKKKNNGNSHSKRVSDQDDRNDRGQSLIIEIEKIKQEHFTSVG